MDRVRSITTAGSVSLKLDTGEVLRGRLAPAEDGRVAVRSDSGDLSVIQWSRVRSINEPPARFRGSVAVAASRLTGNSDRATFSFSARAERATEIDRLAMQLTSH